MTLCRVCKTGFYPTEAQIKAYLWICRICRAIENKQWREKHPSYSEQLNVRPKVMKRKAEQMKGYYWNNPQKPKTRAKSRRLRDAGTLMRQPCEKCGKEHVQIHHDNYNDAYNVRWLCRPCHRLEHAKMEGDKS